MKTLLRLAPAIFLLATSCAPVEDDEPEGLDIDTQALTTGRPFGGNGAVRLSVEGPTETGFCTGVIISSHLVLTAAHCLDVVATTSLTGKANIRIEYARPDGVTFTCLTDDQEQADGSCTNSSSIRFDRMQVGGFPQAKDFAVLSTKYGWHATPGPDNNYYDVVEPWTGSVKKGMRYVVFGAGYGAPDRTGFGVMRYREDALAAVYADTIEIDGDYGQQVCKGDSGGPLLLSTFGPGEKPKVLDRTPPAGYLRLIGLTSTTQGEVCTEIGLTETATRITRAKMDFVNRVSRHYSDWPEQPCGEHPAMRDWWTCW